MITREVEALGRHARPRTCFDVAMQDLALRFPVGQQLRLGGPAKHLLDPQTPSFWGFSLDEISVVSPYSIWDTLFMEVPDEPTATSRLGMDRTSVDMPKQVVQVPLPFM